MRVAIITGASSGLGREFALQIAKKYPNEFDEMWLIARRREQLEEIAQKIDTLLAEREGSSEKKKAIVCCLDLADPAGVDKLEEMLSPEDISVTYLVNAAGLGFFGATEDLARDKQRSMIDLNCRALVDVTAVCIKKFAKKAHVLQIASTAAFQPLQYLNIYSASKAFVLRYSQSLAWELAPRRIRVTAVCPYWVKDTEFIDIAESAEKKRANKHYPLASKTKSVVAHALRVNRTGYWVATASLVSFIHRIWTKISPTAAQMGVYELMRRV